MVKIARTSNGKVKRYNGKPLRTSNGLDCCCDSEQCPRDCARCPSSLDLSLTLSVPADVECGADHTISVTCAAALTQVSSTCFYFGSGLYFNPVCGSTPVWVGAASLCAYQRSTPLCTEGDPPNLLNVEATIGSITVLDLSCSTDPRGPDVFSFSIRYSVAERSACAYLSLPAWNCMSPPPANSVVFQKIASACPTGSYDLISAPAGVTGSAVLVAA